MQFPNKSDLHYLEWGQKDPTVLLLHGLNESLAGYLPAVEFLAPHLHIIALDFRGHGLSPWIKPYRVRDYASDVIHFLEAKIEGPIILAGHSLGGLVAAYLASRQPDLVAGLILEDPPLYIAQWPTLKETPIYTVLRGVRNLLQTHQESAGTVQDMVSQVRQWRVGGEDSPSLEEAFGKDFVARFALELHCCDPQVLDPVLEGSFFDGFDPDQDLAKISCPVHLIAGSFEFGGAMRRQDIERVTALVRNCSHVQWEAAGHDLHTLRPREYAEEVLAFIKAIPPAP